MLRNLPIRPLLDRFMLLVEPITETGCWIFKGKGAYGYGRICLGRRGDGQIAAHRIAYQLFIGPIPEKILVMHKCDVRCCVNPAHLTLGTHAQNSADMRRKNRQAKGAGTGLAVLTEQQVRNIRSQLMNYRYGDYSRLGRAFGVGHLQISRIHRGERWKHVA